MKALLRGSADIIAMEDSELDFVLAQITNRDEDGRTLLWIAAANGHTNVASIIVSAGADVNTQRNDGSSALGIASQEGYIDIVHMFLDKDVQTETRDNLGRTPLWFAAANGQTDVVRALSAAGADVNTQHYDGISMHLISVAGRDTLTL